MPIFNPMIVGGGDQYVLKTGSTMSGPLILPGSPTESLQAANKGYVDEITDGLILPVQQGTFFCEYSDLELACDGNSYLGSWQNFNKVSFLSIPFKLISRNYAAKSTFTLGAVVLDSTFRPVGKCELSVVSSVISPDYFFTAFFIGNGIKVTLHTIGLNEIALPEQVIHVQGLFIQMSNG